MNKLLAIEEIKQLKARYFRWMDAKQWQDWSGVFSEEVIGCFPELNHVEAGRDRLVAFIREQFDGADTIHLGYMPEITLEGVEHASGIWTMEHYIKKEKFTLHGFGHYYEDYCIEDGEWRISRIELQRIKVDTRSFQ